MGGFSAVWNESSLTTLSAVATPVSPFGGGYRANLRFVRVDTTRSVLIIETLNYSPAEMTWTFYVIDRSGAPEFTVSAAFTHVESVIFAELPWSCSLLDTDVLIFIHGVEFADPQWQRLSVGSTVSAIDWGYIRALQSALPAPYDDTDLYADYQPGFYGFGVDYDHAVIEGQIDVRTGPYAGVAQTMTLVELVSGGDTIPVAVVSSDVTGYQAAEPLGDIINAGTPPGSFYRPVADIDTGTDQATAYFTATATSLTVDILHTGTHADNYCRANDGHIWALGQQTYVGTTPWTVATPTTYEVGMIEFDGGSFTTHTFLRQATFNVDIDAIGRAEDAGGGLMLEFGASYWRSDLHARAESWLPSGYFQGPNIAQAHYVTCGMEAASAIVVVYQNWGSLTDPTIYIGAMQEQPIGPFALVDYVGTWPGNKNFPGHVPFILTVTGNESYAATRDTYWHPITTFEWHWDDGDVENAPAIAPHTYRTPSTSHSVMSDSAPTLLAADWGMIDSATGLPYLAYGPALVVIDTLGRRSDIVPKFGGPVFLSPGLIPPYQRVYPRDDGLGVNAGHIFPPPTSQQGSTRVGPNGSYT